MFPFSSSLLSAGFNPLSVAGIHSYYSADRCTNSGGTATVIPDISGKNEASLTVVSGNPLYTSSDPLFNGRPSLSCVSAARRVEVTFNTPLAQASTFYSVIRVETNANTVYWRSNAGNFTDSAGFYLQSDLLARMQVLDGGQAITSTSALTGGTNYVCCSIYNGASSAIYFNNSVTPNAQAPAQGGLDANSCAVMTVGTFVGLPASYTWTTLLNYSGAHDAITRKKIMKFLGNKYAINIT